MPFVHRVTARFFEVDRAGILFFSRVFEFSHAAHEEMLMAAIGGIEPLIETHRVGMPLVHAEADFERPIRMHDRIDIELTVARLGERSIGFQYTLRGEDGEVRARVQTKHAFVALDGFVACPPPAALLDGMRRLGLLEPE